MAMSAFWTIMVCPHRTHWARYFDVLFTLIGQKLMQISMCEFHEMHGIFGSHCGADSLVWVAMGTLWSHVVEDFKVFVWSCGISFIWIGWIPMEVFKELCISGGIFGVYSMSIHRMGQLTCRSRAHWRLACGFPYVSIEWIPMETFKDLRGVYMRCCPGLKRRNTFHARVCDDCNPGKRRPSEDGSWNWGRTKKR